MSLSPPDAVETVYPLVHRRNRPGRVEPFPTIYYLRDPDLVQAMSELERLGHTQRFQERLAEDVQLMAGLHADHAAYRDQRWAMLTLADRDRVRGSASMSRSFRGGIAGIANFDRIKCLHAHYAHHLATAHRGGTTIGRLIDDVQRDRP